MNSAGQFLHELQTLSVRVSAVGNELVCEAPPGVLTPELRERLTANKPAILRLLANAPVARDMAATEDESSQVAPTLSRAQSSIWSLEQINPGTCAWNISWALDVRGSLDRSALETSFRALLDRNAVLRSRFRNEAGVPVVEYAPLGHWSIDFADLRGLPDAEDNAITHAKAEAQRPFDLERGPLFRVKLLQTADATYLLVVVVHHIVADGWSLGLMGLELSQVYQAILRGGAAPLPPPHADYQAFVRRRRREETTTRADLDFWREKLSGELPVVSLAADRMRPLSGAGRRTSIELGLDLTNQIDAMAREHQATPFMVLLAGFNLLIQRYTGMTDLLVGAHVSGRDRPEFADVIGMFVNTLVLRTSVTPNLTARELLSRIRETSLEAFARQHIEFDRVVEAVRPRRMVGHNPLVRHALAYQNLPPATLQLGAAELTHRRLELAGSRYELSVEVWRTARGLLCDFEYSTDLFEAETIDRMMGHYRRLLAEIVADSHRPVFELPMLSDVEREQLLTAWNGTNTDYPVERRLENLFAEQAVKTPDAPALVYRRQETSYRELDRRANQLANYLRSLSVGPNVLVGVCLERSPDLVVAILAVLKAGGAYVPLDPNYPIQRLAFMLEDSAAPVLITHSALRRMFPDRGCVVELDVVQAIVAGQPPTAPTTGATAENLAYVIYTSGSTGRPKGTMLRHSAGYLVDWAQRTFAPEELSRVVAATSICFDLSVFEFFVPLCTGGAVILVADPLEPPDPSSRPTFLNTVPSALAELARTGAIPDSVRTIVACGEKLNDKVVQALYETTKAVRVYNLYGPTEYTTYATASLTVRGAGCDPPIGRPLCNTQVYVLDAQRQLLPIGVVGELFIAGHGLARGYLGQPELTAERFVENPYGAPGSRMYRTGDLVRWSFDGQLEFIGRVDQQIKLRGHRIELGEIEATLRRHPAIRDAVVLVREDRPDSPHLVAYVVADDTPPSSAALRQHSREWLTEYMVPAVFVILPALPLTPSGKIDRSALPAPPLDQPMRSLERGLMPLIQADIADTFKRVLHLDHYGPHENFFEQGGHSLHVVEAASQLELLMARPISPAWIFQAPTPHELAVLLDATRIERASHMVPLQPLGDRPALFCLHDLSGGAFFYVSLARHLAPDQPVYGLVPGPLEDVIIANPTFDVLTPAYVAAIKKIQARGPYRVVGYSTGGVPAFDVAQALLADGEDVLLIMIDPYIYRSMPAIAHIAKWLWRYASRALGGIRTKDRWVMSKLAQTARWVHRQRQKALDRVLEGLNRRQLAPADAADSRVPDWVSTAGRPLAGSLIQSESTYRFRPYTGAAVLLQGTRRSRMEDFLNADGLNGWDGLFKGPLTRFELPTDHFLMMRDPLVSEVAKIVRRL
jgi:amino acid adenylation domain-containing protein